METAAVGGEKNAERAARILDVRDRSLDGLMGDADVREMVNSIKKGATDPSRDQVAQFNSAI